MKSLKQILKFFTIPLAISAAVIGIVCIILLFSGTFSLSTLGNFLLYVGIGIIILGFAVVNFRRTAVDIHVRHQGTEEQQRRTAQGDLGEYHFGFAVVVAGFILAVSGWMMVHFAVCGRLICG